MGSTEERNNLQLAINQLRISDLLVKGAQRLLAARHYHAIGVGKSPDNLIVFFHGGYFIDGNLDDADAFLRQLASNNPKHVVLAVTYTLAHAEPFPAAVEDAYAALLWARNNKRKLNWNGRNLLVSGIEAGANLATVSAMVSRDRCGPKLTGQVLFMPMLDAELCSESMRGLPASAELAKMSDECATGYRSYLPNPIDRIHPYACPLRSSRLQHLPSTLIISAKQDPLHDEGEQYAQKLVACGVATQVWRIPDTQQPLQVDGRAAWAAVAHNKITDFLNSLTPYSDEVRS